ncbi:sterol desaturase family protein [Segetibacter aerophilus]|uniref:Fatty acid hydroxylase n=1 Tax=Segetibacter aerophilus TaxID=670293 RepID=A0A512BCR8_9BACT|nr:sterol desaturase family protein [Segetibacter aerophilus]GEO09714.1 fatty acid hydroxylase [Segetibacter aerophilus]
MFQNIIDYFQTLEHRPLERLVFLVAGMLLLWLVEGAIPLLSLPYRKNKVRHATVNLSFTAIHLVIHTGFAVLIVLLSDWTKAHGFGIIHWFHTSAIAGIIITIFVLDFFGGWLVHYTQHKMAGLWRFHIIHHADNHVDVTTGLRHHPVESILRGLFFLAGVMVAGAPMYAVMIFQTLLVVTVQFTHANIRLPKWLDKGLSWVIVSPNMHKVHHHFELPYTDSNYGAVFSIWDRALGTFMSLDTKDITYGIDKHYPNEKDEDFLRLMKHPWMKKV